MAMIVTACMEFFIGNYLFGLWKVLFKRLGRHIASCW